MHACEIGKSDVRQHLGCYECCAGPNVAALRRRSRYLRFAPGGGVGLFRLRSQRHRLLSRMFLCRRTVSIRLITAAAMATMSPARLAMVSAFSTMRSCRSGVVGPAGTADRAERASTGAREVVLCCSPASG
jgi:hypothetical protein